MHAQRKVAFAVVPESYNPDYRIRNKPRRGQPAQIAEAHRDAGGSDALGGISACIFDIDYAAFFLVCGADQKRQAAAGEEQTHIARAVLKYSLLLGADLCAEP